MVKHCYTFSTIPYSVINGIVLIFDKPQRDRPLEALVLTVGQLMESLRSVVQTSQGWLSNVALMVFYMVSGPISQKNKQEIQQMYV